ncbi:hypothetical protein Tco_1252948 [Tanacetum coccineum]
MLITQGVPRHKKELWFSLSFLDIRWLVSCHQKAEKILPSPLQMRIHRPIMMLFAQNTLDALSTTDYGDYVSTKSRCLKESCLSLFRETKYQMADIFYEGITERALATLLPTAWSKRIVTRDSPRTTGESVSR